MRLNRIPVLLVLLAVIFTACKGKGPKLTRYVSKESLYVVAFDTKSMASKLEKDSLSMEQMLAVLKDDSTEGDYAKVLGLWNQLKDAGLDFDERVFMSIGALSTGGTTTRVQFLAQVNDASKLEAFVKQMPGAPAITKNGDINLAHTPQYVLAWNKEVAMALLEAQTPDPGNMDTTMQPMPGIKALSDADVLQYFKLDEKSSINSLEPFTELMQKKTDMAIFTNSSSLANSASAGQAMAFMPKLKELLNGIYSATTIDFEDGKVEMKTATYASDKLADLLKKYAGPTVDMSLLNRHPSKDLQLLSAFSFKPELVPEFLKELGMDALFNMALAQGGSNIDEISKAFKGDFAVMVSDFGMTAPMPGKDAEMARSMVPNAKLVMAIRIGDRNAFDKLTGMMQMGGMLRMEGNRIVPISDSMEVRQGIFAGIENDLLVVSNDSALYQGYAAGTSGANVSDQVKNIAEGKSVVFFADAAAILNAVPNSVFDTASVHEKRILDQARRTFKHMYFNAGNFDGKKMEGEGEVMLVDGSKNSLPQMVRFLMLAAEEMKARHKADEALYKAEERKLETED